MPEVDSPATPAIVPPHVEKSARKKRAPNLPKEVVVAWETDNNVTSDDPPYLDIATDCEGMATNEKRTVGIYRLVETRVIRRVVSVETIK